MKLKRWEKALVLIATIILCFILTAVILLGIGFVFLLLVEYANMAWAYGWVAFCILFIVVMYMKE